ncbi:hypothetical protein [Rhodoblastus sp.]|uniref:hypothetical protein n=1 Tax=Rhodoblastus sp. TaxID=1962975 RepID=UPI00260C6253|nr:hypothetical protein [Rhodoblastus sp.]
MDHALNKRLKSWQPAVFADENIKAWRRRGGGQRRKAMRDIVWIPVTDDQNRHFGAFHHCDRHQSSRAVDGNERKKHAPII